MKHPTRRVDTELAVIGTGIAGFAAALFARARGIEVAQFGHSGAMAYTTGYLDLYGAEDARKVTDPWAAVAALAAREPDHPLARLDAGKIRTALDTFVAELNAGRLGYTAPGNENLTALLPYGVTKQTLSVPETMRPGVTALAEKAPALIVDFDGLQGFSAKEFATNIAARWPGLATARLAFPEMEGKQVFPEVMARALETRKAREQLAALLKPLIGGATYVGLPAILGVHKPDAVRADLEDRLGVTLFEIPTIPPGVPGIRLREMFERRLPDLGVKLEPNLKVSTVSFDADGITLGLAGAMETLEVRAQSVLLATGRFLSGGLGSTRTRVFEKLLDLPLRQPVARDAWFNDAYLDPEGHALNRAGVPVDGQFRPVDAGGSPVDPRLHAAGAILADQDWVRSRSGAGLAIATAWGAVQAL